MKSKAIRTHNPNVVDIRCGVAWADLQCLPCLIVIQAESTSKATRTANTVYSLHPALAKASEGDEKK